MKQIMLYWLTDYDQYMVMYAKQPDKEYISNQIYCYSFCQV